jgi:hypothetical protein
MPAPRHADILNRPRGALLALAVGAEAARRARPGGRLETAPAVAAVVRAATEPLTTTTADLPVEETMAFVTALAPVSAAAALFRRALRLDLGPTRIPALDTGAAAWVEEASAIPVEAMTASAPSLTPRKLGAISVVSRQLLRGSQAERLVADAISRKAAKALDQALFGSDAASSAQPAGLLHGLTPLAAGSNGIVPGLAALADAVSEYGNPVFIASPGTTIAIEATVPGLPVFASRAVASDVVIGIVPEALAYGKGEASIEGSTEATIHMSDDPSAFIAERVEDETVVAAPTRSMYQVDCIATRLLVEVACSLRAADAVAFTEVGS